MPLSLLKHRMMFSTQSLDHCHALGRSEIQTVAYRDESKTRIIDFLKVILRHSTGVAEKDLEEQKK